MDSLRYLELVPGPMGHQVHIMFSSAWCWACEISSSVASALSRMMPIHQSAGWNVWVLLDDRTTEQSKWPMWANQNGEASTIWTERWWHDCNTIENCAKLSIFFLERAPLSRDRAPKNKWHWFLQSKKPIPFTRGNFTPPISCYNIMQRKKPTRNGKLLNLWVEIRAMCMALGWD